MNKIIRSIGMLFLFTMLAISSIQAEQAKPSLIPNFGDKAANQQIPKVENRKRLLFLTTIDFPPFNFIDDHKQLTGFHVDMVRALCDELNYKSICQIQALPWQELEAALKDKKGDAIISGIAMTKETRAKFLFSNSYFQFSARFLALQGSKTNSIEQASQQGSRIASIEGSAHQAYAKAYFPNAIHIAYSNRVEAIRALNNNEVHSYFDDGLSLAKILNDGKTLCPCEMIEGAFFSKAYFGNGLAIALPHGSFKLKNSIDWALAQLYEKGVMQELYLRYFPVGIF